jgi:hypothetical protein
VQDSNRISAIVQGLPVRGLGTSASSDSVLCLHTTNYMFCSTCPLGGGNVPLLCLQRGYDILAGYVPMGHLLALKAHPTGDTVMWVGRTDAMASHPLSVSVFSYYCDQHVSLNQHA